MRRVRAGGVQSAEITLDPAASWYLSRVLRLRVGDPVVAFDGAGAERDTCVSSIGSDCVILAALGAVREARAEVPLHLCVGLPKGPAMDLAVRMATELGVTDVWPVLAERTVATGDRVDRWARVAEAAARQCGRADLPRVHPPAGISVALLGIPPGVARWVATPGGDRGGGVGPAAVWVGPEGGWAAHELDTLVAGGCAALSLGPWILRADTAVAVALGRFV